MVLAALVLVLGPAGCSSDEPEPKVAPSTPSSPSTSGVATAPTTPPEATDLTRAGAERFVDFWFRALSAGMVTGSTDDVARLSDEDCRSCQALIQQIDALYAKGGHVRTKGWVVAAKTPNGQFDIGTPSFLIRVDQASRVLLDGSKVVDRTPRAVVPMHITLDSSANAWVVADLEIIE